MFDARGNFTEPHTGQNVPLGTLDVRDYLARIAAHEVEAPDFEIREKLFPTMGPEHRYGGDPLHRERGLHAAVRGGRPRRALRPRDHVDQGHVGHRRPPAGRAPLPLDVPLLVLHDFDKSGFSIVGTLRRSTRRYRFGHGHASRVIDLGLRLEDVDGLETEDVYFANPAKAADNLRLNGATPEEIEFLLEQRVEINAFASDELIEWLEGKLAEHGVEKVVPDERTLADAYRRMRQQALVQEQINAFLAGLGPVDEIAVPDRLARRIRKMIKADPLLPWDEALRLLCT